MKDEMMIFGVGLPRRFKAREKSVFAEEALKRFKAMGYAISLDQIKDKPAVVSNLVVGDIKKAKVVFVAPYDTPSQMLIPNYKYLPFNIRYNMKMEKINLFLQFLIVVLAAILGYFVLSRFQAADWWIQCLFVVAGLLLVWIIFHFSQAIPNKVNFNRNSASIVLCLKLAEELKDQKVAFILADHASTSYRGIRAIQTTYEAIEKKKKFILLDCLGHGDTLVAAHGPNMEKDVAILQSVAGELNLYDKAYSKEKTEINGLALLTNSLKLCVGTIENKEFVIRKTRTKNDIYVDFERLEKIKEMLIAYCKQQGDNEYETDNTI